MSLLRNSLMTLVLLAGVAAAGPLEDANYAVTQDGMLYAVRCDLGKSKTIGRISVPLGDGISEQPVFCDLAAFTPDVIYGITSTALYRIDPKKPGQSKRIGNHGLDNPYGMTIGLDGQLLVNTRDGQVGIVNKETARGRLVGPMGGGFRASGDICLLRKVFYSSVKDATGAEQLVTLDAKTGKATLIGALRYADGRAVSNVFGLVDREGKLYGLASGGALIEIDVETARCTLLEQTSSMWWGATSFIRL